ncbi:hypothetical protein MLD38_005335 [Melastoma candidum]|uniref:Uncharacterized protein n=1 Tax=Melastoma candidum TaxID=119954 RepID=A0ACB9S8F2_9MYRT|nr:hypothetical protein MLD38_005335 [Melastoma candidum]
MTGNGRTVACVLVGRSASSASMMEGAMMIGQPQMLTQQPPPSAGTVAAEKLNAVVVQQLNLESVRIRDVSLSKAVLPHHRRVRRLRPYLRQPQMAGCAGAVIHGEYGAVQYRGRATMQSQNLVPRMQYALSGPNAQRTHTSQILNDQMFNMGAASATGLMPMQQQQQAVSRGAFPTMVPTQTLQPGMGARLKQH